MAIDLWKNELRISKEEAFKFAFLFIKNNIIENDERVFRWKLLHKILPQGILLKRWKIINSDKCVKCGVTEDYNHYFITCPELSIFWEILNRFFEEFEQFGHRL